MKLVKKQDVETAGSTPAASGLLGRTIDRRTFLRRTGIAAGGAAIATTVSMRMMRRADAASAEAGDGDVVTKQSVCTHCSVGCGIIAEVQNGVWTGQEPDFDSPINLGGHCAKGAAVREHGHGDKRLKYPMKLVAGKWQRLSWDQAIDEIGDKVLAVREQYSPDSVYWLGSAKFSNEQSYLYRKFAALWGTNNVDHQARICHSTTVAGVANTWGYGAMTNSYNDMHNVQVDALHRQQRRRGAPGRDAAHPARQGERRQTDRRRPALHAHGGPRRPVHAHPFRHRRAADLGHALAHLRNGWEDKEYINQRVCGMDEVRAEVAKWPPEVVENVTGIPPEK